MDKVIISIAPVKAGKVIDYQLLSKDIIDCIDNGAAICHLHARNSLGDLSADCSDMIKCFEEVISKRDVIVQASTGGISDLTISERCQPLEYSIVQSCSLNGGSTNLGEHIYKNSLADVRYVAEKAFEKKIIPEIEVFDIGMLQSVEVLSDSISFEEPKLYNLVFGHLGGMQAAIDNLFAFKNFVPKQDIWGVTHYGRNNWYFLAAAIAMGARVVRIGFEDSDYLDANNLASTNVEVVAKLKRLIEEMGLFVATVDEAKSLLKIR